MAQVTITINSREYAVACEDGQEVRILQLARIMDEKAKLLTQSGGQINENMLLAMVGLLLADELSELRKGIVPQNTSNNDDFSKRILELDSELANKIKTLVKEINSVASQIELL